MSDILRQPSDVIEVRREVSLGGGLLLWHLWRGEQSGSGLMQVCCPGLDLPSLIGGGPEAREGGRDETRFETGAGFATGPGLDICILDWLWWGGCGGGDHHHR